MFENLLKQLFFSDLPIWLDFNQLGARHLVGYISAHIGAYSKNNMPWVLFKEGKLKLGINIQFNAEEMVINVNNFFMYWVLLKIKLNSGIYNSFKQSWR